LRERRERALHHLGRVVRLAGEVFVLPPERALALVDLTEAGLAEPGRQPRAGRSSRTRPCLDIARNRAPIAGDGGLARVVK
jgi:hypothetical protein